MRRLALPILLACAGLFLLVWPASLVAGPPTPSAESQVQTNDPRLHPALRRALAAADDSASLPIIVEWARDPMLPQRAAVAQDKLARRRQVIAALKADADRTAGPIRQTIQLAAQEGLASNVRSFWASPIIALDAKPKLIESLGARKDIVQIRLDSKIELEETPFVSTTSYVDSIQWNLDMIDAGLATDALGLDGSGVVVANLDSGVDWDHPALHEKYRGYNPKGPPIHAGNWYVATTEEYRYPGDGAGHGTHTMGTIVGDDGAGNRTGVAPGARWIAVKLFTNNGFTYESWIHDAFQWILAPNDDPALAPDIVNNSWGTSNSADDRYRADVAALRAAGILPVFSAGNNGPNNRTVGSPGSYPESVAVGAVDEERMVAIFSSRGPSPWNETKPEVAAPGVNVRSTMPGGGYAIADGTSMAAPHVAGLAALLLQADPSLSPDEIEALLTSTATPISTKHPNNNSGWGIVDAYAAGLQVTGNGELLVDVVRTDGAYISRPRLQITQRDGSTEVSLNGDTSGRITVALTPGRYDLTASTFGFEPANAYSIEVLRGSQTSVRISLTQQPLGSVFGRVTDTDTGSPLSATVTVDDTPIATQTDPDTGAYSLALPDGTWPIRVEARAHRIGHISPTVAAGAGTSYDVALEPAPHILLVDSGRWYYSSQIQYFENALEALNYPYDLWSIKNPYGLLPIPEDRPMSDTLSAYDMVVWSAPLDSPGLLDLYRDLKAYLDQGGRLLLSGQDIAFWDAGGYVFGGVYPYFVSDLGSWFKEEGNLADLAGEGPLDGVTMQMNTPDSAQQQAHPDAVTIRNTLLAAPAARWPDASIGAVTAGICRPYRAAWMGAGLEGVGPQSARETALDRLLTWLTQPPDEYGLVTDSTQNPLIGRAGTQVSRTFRLHSTGIATDTVNLSVAGGAWPLDVALSDGRHLSVGGSANITLTGCSSATLTATIGIPAVEPRDSRVSYTLRFASNNDTSVVTTATLAAKTPASLLLVDDQRFYHEEGKYTQTLEALDIGYDIYTTGADSAPPTETLASYPMAVWTTGYDWFRPLRSRDETLLGDYLDGGGRLLLSSQDIIDVSGINDFVKTRLGVADATLVVTPTDVTTLPGNPLGLDFGPRDLVYPFRNWSDGIEPAPGASGILRDQNHFTSAVVRPADTWRTAFSAFPLETLDVETRHTLMSRTLVWLSPLGESRLGAPSVAAEGDRIPISLTVGLADTAARSGLRANVPLPAEASIVVGSVQGPWHYDAGKHALLWEGALSPSTPITLRADLDLAGSIPDGTVLPLRARLYAGDGLTVTDEAPVHIDVPWLTITNHSSRTEARIGETVAFSATVANRGPVATMATLSDTLDAGFALVESSLSAPYGIITPTVPGFEWRGMLIGGQSATIHYTASITGSNSTFHLWNDAIVTDSRDRRQSASIAVIVRSQLHMPLIFRTGVPARRQIDSTLH